MLHFLHQDASRTPWTPNPIRWLRQLAAGVSTRAPRSDEERSARAGRRGPALDPGVARMMRRASVDRLALAEAVTVVVPAQTVCATPIRRAV